jgi:hypothetical protein
MPGAAVQLGEARSRSACCCAADLSSVKVMNEGGQPNRFFSERMDERMDVFGDFMTGAHSVFSRNLEFLVAVACIAKKLRLAPTESAEQAKGAFFSVGICTLLLDKQTKFHEISPLVWTLLFLGELLAAVAVAGRWSALPALRADGVRLLRTVCGIVWLQKTKTPPRVPCYEQSSFQSWNA